MMHMRLALTVCVALLLASAVGAQVSRDPSPAASPRTTAGGGSEVEFPACPSQIVEPSDPRWLWRLRAYTHLDCVTTIVDRALEQETDARPGDEDQTVTISRADLERIRTLAWWARDAAARIGQ